MGQKARQKWNSSAGRPLAVKAGHEGTGAGDGLDAETGLDGRLDDPLARITDAGTARIGIATSATFSPTRKPFNDAFPRCAGLR